MVLAARAEATSCLQSLLRHLLLLRTSPFDLVYRNVGMLPLPVMLVQSKAYRLWLWNAWEHTHLDNYLAWICGCL